MLDMLDTLSVRELVRSLPRGERALAELLMAGHTQASAADQLGITARSIRYRVHNIRSGCDRTEGEAVPPSPQANET